MRSNLVHESSVSDDPTIPSGFVIYWLVADLSTCLCSLLYLLPLYYNSLPLITIAKVSVNTIIQLRTRIDDISFPFQYRRQLSKHNILNIPKIPYVSSGPIELYGEEVKSMFWAYETPLKYIYTIPASFRTFQIISIPSKTIFKSKKWY